MTEMQTTPITGPSSLKLFTRSRSFWFGLTLPINAARLIIANRALLLLSLIPLLITILISYFVIGELRSTADTWLSSLFIENFGGTDSIWFTIAEVIQWILVTLLGAVLFIFLAAIVSSPFNDFLAEKTEPVATPPLQSVGNIPWAQQLRLIWVDLIKTGAVFIATLLSFLLSLIPFVNFIVIAITFCLVSYQFVTYPQTRRGVELKESLKFLRRHFFACVGFGMSVSFLFAIPILGTVVLPLAVVGGTLLYARAQEHAEPFPLK